MMQAGEDFGHLADLVAYQSGSVVSRTLLKSEGGNLTVFAFDKDEGLSKHTTPHEALVLVLDGNVEIEIGSQVFTLQIGDFIRLPAQIPHSVHAIEKMKMALLLFPR